MTDNPQDNRLQLVNLALASDATLAEEMYSQLIDDLESIFGKNHKEVAAELQRIAHVIEESGKPEAAFSFKQRTCEIMLRRNMEQRRLSRAGASAQEMSKNKPVPISSPPISQITAFEYLCIPVDDVDKAITFYKSILQAQIVFEKGQPRELVGLKVEKGPALILSSRNAIGHMMPLFSVDALETLLSELLLNKVESAGRAIETPLGKIHLFIDDSANHFGLYQRKL